MLTGNTSVVRARIDSALKQQAKEVLAEMGLSASEAIRMFLVQVVSRRRLPFDVKAPSDETRAAIEELEAGRGHRAKTVKDMMAALDAGG